MTLKLNDGTSLDELQSVYALVKKLHLPVVEEAFSCLYHSQKPESQVLLDLDANDWALLLALLSNLLVERKLSSLH